MMYDLRMVLTPVPNLREVKPKVIGLYLYFIVLCRSDDLSHYLLDTDLAFDPDPGSEVFPAIALVTGR
jgi:hypothetical protein